MYTLESKTNHKETNTDQLIVREDQPIPTPPPYNHLLPHQEPMITDNPATTSAAPPITSFKSAEILSGIEMNALVSGIDHMKIHPDPLIV